METVKITIKTENAAFADGNCENEVARILHEIAEKFEDGRTPWGANDINGNKVAKVEVE